MKNKNQNHLLFIEVIPIFTISLIFIIPNLGLFFNTHGFQRNDITYQNISLLNSGDPYTLTSPISIDNSNPNYNWNKTAFENDWCSGQGTAEDPYIIRNIIIDGLNSDSCISIRDSFVHFRIENCSIFNASIGSLLNIKAGIKLENVKNGVIVNNEISNNNGTGLFGFNCDNNNISGNTINNNKNGISMLFCESNNIIGNEIRNQSEDGINFLFCDFNKISENSINGNKNGIIFYFSNNNTISENNLIGNDVFIYEELCKGNIIQNNIYWEEIPEEEDEIPTAIPQDLTLLILLAAIIGVAGGLSVGIVVQSHRNPPMAGLLPKKTLKGKQMLIPPIVDAKEYRPDMSRINLNADETIKKIKDEDSFLTREAIEQLRQKEKRYEAVKEVKKEKLHEILNNHEKPEQKLTIIESPDQIPKNKESSNKRITKKVVNGKK